MQCFKSLRFKVAFAAEYCSVRLYSALFTILQESTAFRVVVRVVEVAQLASAEAVFKLLVGMAASDTVASERSMTHVRLAFVVTRVRK